MAVGLPRSRAIRRMMLCGPSTSPRQGSRRRHIGATRGTSRFSQDATATARTDVTSRAHYSSFADTSVVLCVSTENSPVIKEVVDVDDGIALPCPRIARR